MNKYSKIVKLYSRNEKVTYNFNSGDVGVKIICQK